MRQKLILQLSLAAAGIVFIGLTVFVPAILSIIQPCTPEQDKSGICSINITAAQGQAIGISIFFFILAGIVSLIAWIGALIRTVRMQSWGWFAVALLLGWLGTLIYALAGPPDPPAVAAASAQQPRATSKITPGKPVASILVTVLWVVGFVAIPSVSGHIPLDPVNYAVSLNSKWLWIILFTVIWLMFQLFWRASSETTKLSLGVSYTLVWLALAFFFPFKDPTIESQAGTVAFFLLAGGLGLVLIWTRFLADEV